MTRLSDSLRGLADRAPVDEVSVSTPLAMRRIYRGRRLRAAANATAGLGVAAVIALAVIHPGAGSSSSMADAGALDASQEGAKAAAPEAFDGSGASELAWGQCGTRPFEADTPVTSDVFSLTLADIGGEVEPGAAVTAKLTFTRTDDAPATAYESTGTSFIVLWNGTVVGTAQSDVSDLIPQDLADNTATLDSQIDLVNCWDGTPLPGGAYELVAYQDFYPASDQSAPPAEPTLVPIDPTLVPIDPTLVPMDPTLVPIDPTTAPESPITVDGDAGTAASTDGGATAGDTGTVDPAADAPAERAVSNTVTFVVAGDVPDDPFGAYLSPAVPAVVYPDDYLTPAAARDEYATRVTSGKWDMAAGTQRVVKSGDSTTMDDQNAWLDGYYGCSADGTTTPSFPAASADWPLLKVEANLPGSVGVSYGWVVNGNPEVDVSVTNISGHTLPGFWGQPNTTLYLVKDGKVAATSYLAPTDPNAYTRSQATDGLLSPDGTLGGTYLWRDVSGCWIGDAQTTIASGTYTVLMEQDIYLDNGNAGNGGPVVYFDDKAAVDGAANGAGSDASENSGVVGGSVTAPRVATDAPSLVAPAPAPDAGTYDWLSLQVWTSLGKVTVK